MSDFRILQALSRFLRQTVFDGLSGTSDLAADFTTPNAISFDSPARLANGGGNGSGTAPLLSLYLYYIVPNNQLNNRPLIQAAPGVQRYPPLSLNLQFLLTPLANSPEDNLVILGRSMQILASTPIMRANFLDSDLRPQSPEVRVALNPLSAEELTRIWNAFNEPYRLSVVYHVQAVSIDSVRGPQEGPPVVERLVDFNQIG